ncbi:histidine kinase dimerization/phospho-acceptor domain-containing protein [Paenibacillus larvae]|nr:histidine kinase dimerization/phospho-acceptor domain-containing protein [Paenibacillus larvae]MDT2261458.1 histidine kinase dimerization/phospho-acceptor domain-containing protein [Paenibacillus larvae]
MRGQLGYSEDLESWKREMSTVVDRLEDRIARLEKVRRTLSADIVHELRTPLISMKTQLERALVAETRLSPEKMHELFEEVDRMYRLVQDLQNLGLAEAGNLPLSKRWFSLSDNLKVAVEMMKQAAEQAGISLTLEIKRIFICMRIRTGWNKYGTTCWDTV